MNWKIGVKNFRGFTHLDPIGLGPITFLVGPNNAGKSTLVKAWTLLRDYLLSSNPREVDFANNKIDDLNIFTFARAKNRNVPEDYLEITVKKEAIRITLQVTGEEGWNNGHVTMLRVDDEATGISCAWNPSGRTLEISRPTGGEGPDSVSFAVQFEVPDGRQGISIFRKGVMSDLFDLVKTIVTDIKKLPAPEEVDGWAAYNSRVKHGMATRLEEPYEQYDALKAIDFSMFEKRVTAVVDGLPQSGFYLGIYAAKQPRFFTIDRMAESPMTQAIHEFSQLRLTENDPQHAFIRRWMAMLPGRFLVGDDFKIVSHAGEAYEVNIKKGAEWSPLSDLGMGSIHVMLLLFRLATAMHNARQLTEDPFPRPIPCLCLIEEPELNLHPALQSLMPDLFLEIKEEMERRDIQFHFVVETHSEYIIRRTQVIVAERELASKQGGNPFAVIYIPGDPEQQPYEMLHQVDGTFDKSFGSGFLDEASRHTLELIRMRREKGTK